MSTYVFANGGKSEQRSDLHAWREVLVTTDATIQDAVSGDLILVANDEGWRPCIALTDYDAVLEQITVDLGGVWDLSVTAIDDKGNHAIVWGDVIYYDDTASRLDLVRSDTGQGVGIALEAITSGDTDTIAVALMQWPPEKTLA